MKIEDLTGQKFGKWTVLEFSHVAPRGRAVWLCRCECGTERKVYAYNLNSGASTSCWCSKNIHGMAGKPIYKAWVQMKQRCYNPHDPQFHNYGARGIAVCNSWRESFAAFLADMGERPIGTTLDRIDNDGPYAPDNCRWATDREQCRNTRQNHVIEHDGQSHTVIEWSEISGLAQHVIRSRLRLGWSIEDALTRPVRQHS